MPSNEISDDLVTIPLKRVGTILKGQEDFPFKINVDLCQRLFGNGWPLLQDKCGLVGGFMDYANTNHLRIYEKEDMKPDNIRTNLLKSINEEIPLVIDMGDSDDLIELKNLFNAVTSGLWESLQDKSLLDKSHLEELATEDLCFEPKRTADESFCNFQFILVTTKAKLSPATSQQVNICVVTRR